MLLGSKQTFFDMGIFLPIIFNLSRIVPSDDDPPLEFFIKTPIDIFMHMKLFSRDEIEKLFLG